MEFGSPGPEPRLDEVLLLIQRPQEVRPGLGGVLEHHSWGRLGPRATRGGWFIPMHRVPSPVRSTDWDKTRGTGVDWGLGGWLDDEGTIGLAWLGLEVLRRGTGRPTWP